jgi:hypothetical protein
MKYKVVRNTENNPYKFQYIENGETITKDVKQNEVFELDVNKVILNKDMDSLVDTLFSEYHGAIEEVDFEYPKVDQAKGSSFIAVKDDGKTKDIVQDKINKAILDYRTKLAELDSKTAVKK